MLRLTIDCSGMAGVPASIAPSRRGRKGAADPHYTGNVTVSRPLGQSNASGRAEVLCRTLPAVFIIGRDPDNTDVCVSIPGPQGPLLSRRHCEVSVDEVAGMAIFSVRDLESINGTFVNGQRCLGSARAQCPGPVCVIEFGVGSRVAPDALLDESLTKGRLTISHQIEPRRSSDDERCVVMKHPSSCLLDLGLPQSVALLTGGDVPTRGGLESRGSFSFKLDDGLSLSSGHMSVMRSRGLPPHGMATGSNSAAQEAGEREKEPAAPLVHENDGAAPSHAASEPPGCSEVRALNPSHQDLPPPVASDDTTDDVAPIIVKRRLPPSAPCQESHEAIEEVTAPAALAAKRAKRTREVKTAAPYTRVDVHALLDEFLLDDATRCDPVSSNLTNRLVDVKRSLRALRTGSQVEDVCDIDCDFSAAIPRVRGTPAPSQNNASTTAVDVVSGPPPLFLCDAQAVESTIVDDVDDAEAWPAPLAPAVGFQSQNVLTRPALPGMTSPDDAHTSTGLQALQLSRRFSLFADEAPESRGTAQGIPTVSQADLCASQPWIIASVCHEARQVVEAAGRGDALMSAIVPVIDAAEISDPEQLINDPGQLIRQAGDKPSGKKRKTSKFALAVDALLSKTSLGSHATRHGVVDLIPDLADELVNNPTDSATCRVVSDPSERPLVLFSPAVSSLLAAHQRQAVRFCWRELIQAPTPPPISTGFASRFRVRDQRQDAADDTTDADVRNGAGCVIAHSMGLGKTFSAIAFIFTFWRWQEMTRARAGVRRIVITAPKSVVLHWAHELMKWGEACQEESASIFCVVGNATSTKRAEVLRDWMRQSVDRRCVLVLGHRCLANVVLGHAVADGTSELTADAKSALTVMMTEDDDERSNAAAGHRDDDRGATTSLRDTLMTEPLLLVVDEAHKAVWPPHHRLATAINCIFDTNARASKLLLTGTPAPGPKQSGSMVGCEHLKAMLAVVYPAVRGQRDQELAIQHALPRKIQRCTVKALGHQLPPLSSTTIVATTTPLQYRMIRSYFTAQDAVARQSEAHRKSSPFAAINFVNQTTAHPWIAANTAEDATDFLAPVCAEVDRLPGLDAAYLSPKLCLCLKIIAAAKQLQRRVVIFSRFRAFLAIIGNCLTEAGLVRHRHWTFLDGSQSELQRQHAISMLNDAESHCFVLLASAVSAGLGISLTGASVVVLAEPQWHVSTEDQLIGRCYRLGQPRSGTVDVIRLVGDNQCERCLWAKTADLQSTEEVDTTKAVETCLSCCGYADSSGCDEDHAHLLALPAATIRIESGSAAVFGTQRFLSILHKHSPLVAYAMLVTNSEEPQGSEDLPAPAVSLTSACIVARQIVVS